MDLALNVTFVGMFIVFLSLILLSLIIYIFGKAVASHKSGEKGKNAGASEEPPVPEAGRINRTASPAGEASADELIAVLTAAVMAYSKPGVGSDIVVKSFRRIPLDSPVWNVTGRMEHIAGKL